jgi:endonuclease/exonuclease/phosphatase family metal-dependent hydrolase
MLQEATDTGVVAALAEAGRFPHHGCQARQSTGFLSRRPVEDHAWHRPRGAKHPFLEVVLSGTGFRLFGLHLTAWFSNWSERRRTMEISALLQSIKQHQDGPHLIAGDFNALAPGERLDSTRMPRWIRAMIWLSGRDIARSTIQVMLDARYSDVWSRLNPGAPGYTFPVWDPHVRLDYMFMPERDAARVTRCEVLSALPESPVASDHFPLLVELEEG